MPPEDPRELALDFSRYAQRATQAQPALTQELAQARPWPLERMQTYIAAELAAGDNAQMTSTMQSDASLARALRALRSRVMLSLIARDLAGAAALEEVFSTMGALAQASIVAAQAHHGAALIARHGVPIGEESREPQSLVVVAMGKLGGGELNVSSDIDLVFVYPEEGETSGGPGGSLSNHEFFAALGKRIIAALAEVNEYGFVFRVDMRLRPYGDSGPLVSSLAMLEQYFATQARAWERYAWAKALAVSGEDAHRVALRSLVRPFVYRRYLDFVALENLRSMHAQVREEVKRRDRADDIKLGPGGIREIEFIAQVFQLIRGGHDASLQVRGTVETLRLLALKRLIPESTVNELLEAYFFLRKLEHRLQYRDDAQTQRLPSSAEELTALAGTMQFPDSASLLQELAQHRERVTRHFDAVFTSADAPSAGPGPAVDVWNDCDATRQQLSALGYVDVDEVMRRLSTLKDSARYRQLPESGRAKLEKLVPEMVRAAARQAKPALALTRMLDLVEAIGRRESYLALMIEYPQTLERVAALSAWSAWATKYLQQHPILLDELLDPRHFGREPIWPQLAEELAASLQQNDGDAEREMDTLRHFKQAQLFHLIAQDFAGKLSVERLSDHLSELADLILTHTLALAWRSLPKRHRDAPQFAVIGFGKLGGKELGYGSDLDIVFLYDDDANEAPEQYARLAQRLNAWLNAFTGAGVLYQSDLRLRPDGASGLLVSSFSAFTDYQQQQAWTWEHQALTRARFCAGDPRVGNAFEALRVATLRQRRDLGELRQSVLAMRGKMRGEHRPVRTKFDLKSDPGGLIDVEFAVQYLVLAHACDHEILTKNSGNIALLRDAAALGLIPADIAQHAADAYRELRRLQHQAWLAEITRAVVDPDVAAPHAAAVRALWTSVFDQ